MLAQVVVEHVDGGRYLGPEGWTPDRRRALGFASAADARDWLAEVKATAPVMIGEGEHRLVPQMVSDTQAAAGLGAVVSDFDPFP